MSTRGRALAESDDAAEAYLGVAVRRLVEHFQPERIVLFGSRARHEARPDSDIDLLVILPSVEDYWATVGAMLDALHDRAIPVDIVVADARELATRADQAGSVFGPALRDGVVLYERR